MVAVTSKLQISTAWFMPFALEQLSDRVSNLALPTLVFA